MKNRNPKYTPVANILGAFAKLLRTTESEGVTMSHWQKPIDNIPLRRNLAKYLKAGCPKINTKGTVVQPTFPEGEELTRLILGDDYLSAEEIAKAFGFEYSDAQLEQLAKTLPTDFETLLSIKAEGMLVAGPPSDTTLLGVRDLGLNRLFVAHPIQTWRWRSKKNPNVLIAYSWRTQFKHKEKVSNFFARVLIAYSWRTQFKQKAFSCNR